MEIDTFEASLFNPAEWIGTGKKYKDLPGCVTLAAQEAMAIPSDIRDTLPRQDEPILDFIQRTLPVKSNGINTFPMHAWFSCKEPSTVSNEDTPKNIMRRTVPSQDFINKLEREFGQQWFDGKQSIVDPRYNQGHDRYPFWVLTVWREILSLINKQKDWREAYTVIAQEIKGDMVSQVYTNVESFLGSCGWNSEIEHGGYRFTSHTFAPLLCKRPLYDDVAQAMIYVLQQRLEKSREQYPHHVIAASLFYKVLQVAADKSHIKKNKKLSTLKAIEDRVRHDPDTVLWYPVLHSKHEIAICVDFRLKEIRYGELFDHGQ
jgi:hypothetical protein